MTNNIGNISTIVKWISMTIAGYAIGVITAHGLHFGVDAATLSEVIGAFIFLILGYIDSKYPNTFKCLDNQCSCNLETEDIIEDIDPAGDYDDGC